MGSNPVDDKLLKESRMNLMKNGPYEIWTKLHQLEDEKASGQRNREKVYLKKTPGGVYKTFLPIKQ